VELLGKFEKFDALHIKRTDWHQLCNETDQPLKIIEIQYGENCVEEDIERQ
jgi:mannose-6-phosphate isomerase-like protein (cupin superfamily)